MDEILELRSKIVYLAALGRVAAIMKDMEVCLKCQAELEPLLREYSRLTGDNWANQAADEGVALNKKARQKLN